MLALHMVLLFGWGFALNDSAGGSQYCWLAVPSIVFGEVLPWAFTAAGIAVLLAIDACGSGPRPRLAFYPAAAFAIVQEVALWIGDTSIRY